MCEKYLPVIIQRITDSFIQKVMADINGFLKGIFYKQIDLFSLQFYLSSYHLYNKKQRIRLASHNPRIESGCHKIYEKVKECVNFVNPTLKMSFILPII